MTNINRLGGELSESELMYGLSKIADQKKIEYIDLDIYLSLESKGLVYMLGDKELLTEKGEETLENLKKTLNDILIKHGYNISNYEELLLVTDDVQKTVRDIMSSIEPEGFIDITLETPIDKLIFFPDDDLSNKSIILELQQYYNIYTLGDLMKSKLIGFTFLKSKKNKEAFRAFLGEIEKLGFIKK